MDRQLRKVTGRPFAHRQETEVPGVPPPKQQAHQLPYKLLRTFRAVRACPACQTIASPIRRVAGRMVVALAEHTAFAIATRRAGWGKRCMRGDWGPDQGLPTHWINYPGDGSQRPNPRGRVGLPNLNCYQEGLGYSEPHVSGRRGLGILVRTHSCHSQVHKYPHFCRYKCCCSWLPKTPLGKAGGTVRL